MSTTSFTPSRIGFHTITHPTFFTEGVRVLLLKARHKDGQVGHERAIQRVSHDAVRFHQHMDELLTMMRPYERIYSTASPRDLAKAYRLFQSRQVDALYDADPMEFPRHLENRWYSCLMKPETQSSHGKYWMFDCDGKNEFDTTWSQLTNLKVEALYSYPTKSGMHILCAPFNKMNITPFSRDLLHDNPLMLWAYHD